MSELSENLKKYRNELNLTQDDLAKELFVTRQAISKWESGESTPDVNNLIKLADTFHISLDNLILGKDTDALVDSEEFVFDPRKKRYVRRYGKMNFWDFLAKYWWTIIIILGVFSMLFPSHFYG